MTCHSRPKPAAAELAERFGPDPAEGIPSEFLPVEKPEEVRRFVDVFDRRVERKSRLCEWAIGDRDNDFVFVTFTEAHCVGHRCWSHHDPSHPLHDAGAASQFPDPVRQIYRSLDRAVGAALDACGPEDRVLVYCSHGMGPNHTGTRLLDRALVRMQGNSVDTQTGWLISAARSIWRRLPEGVRRRFWGLRNRVSNDGFQPGREGRPFFEVLVNDRTAGVRINLKGRESRGVVEPGDDYDAICRELMEELKALKNPDSGEPLAESVELSRELHPGERAEALPDLLVTWNRNHLIRAAVSDRIGRVDCSGLVTHLRSGDHRPVGRFFAMGPGWRQGRLDRMVNAEDFYPTITALFDAEAEPGEGTAIEELARLQDLSVAAH